MTDPECVQFLQWALPRLGLRWSGFRKVRRQVHKRINRRLAELGLPDLARYRAYLEARPDEWAALAGVCRISISRFYRDRRVFDVLGESVLPELAERAAETGRPEVRVWSAGCASGEEPYTVAILWQTIVQPRFPQVRLKLIATDADEQLLEPARRARYPASNLKEIPTDWRGSVVVPDGNEYRIRTEAIPTVEFQRQDIRVQMPEGPFHLVLCRHLVFTYFDERLQRELLSRIVSRIVAGGFLVIGRHEQIPAGTGVEASDSKEIYRIVKNLEQASAG